MSVSPDPRPMPDARVERRTDKHGRTKWHSGEIVALVLYGTGSVLAVALLVTGIAEGQVIVAIVGAVVTARLGLGLVRLVRQRLART